MMKTISKRRVLSSALVAELRITASIRQKTKGPQRSPRINQLIWSLTIPDFSLSIIVEDRGKRVDHYAKLVPYLSQIPFLKHNLV